MEEKHTQHLKGTLEQFHKVTSARDVRRYIGITLDWDHKIQQVHLSVTGYIKTVLKQFQYDMCKQHQKPFPTVQIKYGSGKKQYSTQEFKSPLLLCV
jgi:hypothetical protein